MLKSTFLAGLLGLAAMTSAYAQDNTAQCDDPSMQQLQSSIEMQSDQAMKTAAMEHMKLAQASMQSGKLDECAVHMGEARKALGAKP